MSGNRGSKKSKKLTSGVGTGAGAYQAEAKEGKKRAAITGNCGEKKKNEEKGQNEIRGRKNRWSGRMGDGNSKGQVDHHHLSP